MSSLDKMLTKALFFSAALALTFFLTNHSGGAIAEEFGFLRGNIVSISPKDTEIEVIEDSGDIFSFMIAEETLIWREDQIVPSLSPDHISMGVNIEYTQLEDGRLVCEWLEFNGEDKREMKGERRPVSRRENNRLTEKDSYAIPKMKTTAAEAVEEPLRLSADQKPGTESFGASSDADPILTEGKSLIEMTPEEYSDNVDKEAQKILEELGIE